MSFSIRDAETRDLPAITAIYRESVLNGTATYEIDAPDEAEMASRFAAITGRGYPYVVATNPDGLILGYAYASAFRARPAYNWLVEDSIYLSPEARGQGIGRALVDELVSRCTALGFRQMVAVIGGASQASIGVHRAAGFSMCGTMQATGFKLGQWLDTVFMQIALGEGSSTPPDLTRYPAYLP
jgi:L-amino acid N-acyltransferase YncA